MQGDSVGRRTGESGISGRSLSGERGNLRLEGDLVFQSAFMRHLENGVAELGVALKISTGEAEDNAMVRIFRAPKGVPQ